MIVVVIIVFAITIVAEIVITVVTAVVPPLAGPDDRDGTANHPGGHRYLALPTNPSAQMSAARRGAASTFADVLKYPR